MTPRIAVVFEFGTLNGGERSMLAAMRQLGEKNVEFVALSPPHGPLVEEVTALGIRQIPLPLRDEHGNRLPRNEVCAHLLEAAVAAAPDLLHANSLAMGRLTGAIANQLPFPTTAHLRDILKLSGAAVADLNRNRRLMAVSEATRRFHEQQGVQSSRLLRLPNGVDCRQFRPRGRTGLLRAELGLPDEAFLVATVGQIGMRKGQDVLADALCRLAPQMADMHWLLIGERHSQKAENIAFEEGIRTRFEEAGIAERLHRLGSRHDIARLMNEADLLVHPARQEPLGRVLLEAAASGLPILATRVGGTEEILQDGLSARLVPADDGEALAAGIRELHRDPAQRDRLAQSARRRVERHFNIEQTAEQLATAWQSAIVQ